VPARGTDRVPGHESGTARDGTQRGARSRTIRQAGREVEPRQRDGLGISRMAAGDTEIPRGESKERDRAGCSSLNRLPAFVPTREFLPIIAGKLAENSIRFNHLPPPRICLVWPPACPETRGNPCGFQSCSGPESGLARPLLSAGTRFLRFTRRLIGKRSNSRCGEPGDDSVLAPASTTCMGTSS
jgi:hypothetical protein